MIKLKRVYDPVDSADGERFLVERLWPRGVKKTALRVDAWVKDVAPSGNLRRWFSHDPKKWHEFRRRYFRELDVNAGALEPILKAARRGRVTLVYSSHDTEHNNAVALKDYLEEFRTSQLHETPPMRAVKGGKLWVLLQRGRLSCRN